MSLTKKINSEIASWEKKVEVHQQRIDKIKVEIKQLRRLLNMAEGIEDEQR